MTEPRRLSSKKKFNVRYYKVQEHQRGLTKQRNFGISKVGSTIEVICFLDDDIELTPGYFLNLVGTYNAYPDAIGVGGRIIDDVQWKKAAIQDAPLNPNEFVIDGFIRKDSSRFILRKRLGLLAESFPTFMPKEGHGRSVGFIPPTGKTYKVETFMGGVSSFKREVFDTISFSEYFEGYGLYEDTDFTLRCSRLGSLYLNTAAELYHYHQSDGRPDQFLFGKMVVRNGWYVWRVKNYYPGPSAIIKWHLITWLLSIIRLSNAFTNSKRKDALTEALGRMYGWGTLFFNPPALKKEKND